MEVDVEVVPLLIRVLDDAITNVTNQRDEDIAELKHVRDVLMEAKDREA